jgi:hypothetical protein
MAEKLRTQQVKLRLLWIPRHSGIPGNDAANKLAKAAVSPKETHKFRRYFSTQKRQDRKRMLAGWKKEWHSTDKGKHLRRVDDGLPAKRMQRLYSPRQWNRAYLLVQLRTGDSWLATYAKICSFYEEAKCKCRARETVVHVLVDCARLREIRQQLRNKIGDTFNSIAGMLGGKP